MVIKRYVVGNAAELQPRTVTQKAGQNPQLNMATAPKLRFRLNPRAFFCESLSA
jgi:hypothetical protein